MRKGETELRDKLNAAIDAIRKNGKYDEIAKSTSISMFTAAN